MTTSQSGITEVEAWVRPLEKSTASRTLKGLWRFTRKKPLGALCGAIVILALIVGDFVPETVNKISSELGFGKPVPYVVDILEEHTGVVQPYTKQNLRERLAPPSTDHLLGTDGLGRDIFSRLLYGARVAVIVSLGAVLISETIAAAIGICAGYYGGKVDKFFYRIVDIFQALPGLVILITVLGTFGAGLWQMVIAIGLVGAPSGSRLIRGQTVAIMSSPFIESARVLGASDFRIMRHHVLPNVFALIVLGSTLRLGTVVLIEASLSFLGFGLAPPFPSWGQMLSLEGREYMRTAPGLAIYPGLAIAILVFSYNLFGDALRDVLDPRLRGSR